MTLDSLRKGPTMKNAARGLTLLAAGLWLAVGAGCAGRGGHTETAADRDFGTMTRPKSDGSVIYDPSHDPPGTTAREAAFAEVSERCSESHGTEDWELVGERHFTQLVREGASSDTATSTREIRIRLSYRCGRGEAGREGGDPEHGRPGSGAP
jgi:hypothetical protein